MRLTTTILSIIVIVLLISSSAFLAAPKMSLKDNNVNNNNNHHQLLGSSSSLLLASPKERVTSSPVYREKSSSLQSALTNSSLIELGYGPSSLSPISERVPIYTRNDQMWIESRYNNTINAELNAPSGTLASLNVEPKTIVQLYAFNSNFLTSNLDLIITVYILNGSEQSSIPVQFVNPSNNINDLTVSYGINNGTLFASFSSSSLSQNFDTQVCLSNVTTSNEVEVPLPSLIGSGFVGIIGNPNATSATILVQTATPTSPFAFSFELYTNYTYALPAVAGSTPEYVNSEEEVASSPSSILIGSSVVSTGNNASFTLSTLASFRIGRYLVKAFFENSNGIQEVDTTVLITSPYANSWFWLGECQELSDVSASSFSVNANLAGSPLQWPRYLYLMYQTPPGIEEFVNTSLGLDLNRVSFQVNGNPGLPSDIQVSYNGATPTRAIEDVDITNNEQAYIIENGSVSYPVQATFTFSFGGESFQQSDVTLDSPYQDTAYAITLGELLIAVTQGGKGVGNASVAITSGSGALVSTLTDQFGNANVFVPIGSYSITIRVGSYIKNINQTVSSGSAYNVAASFPGQIDYGLYLTWLIYITTALGVLGNLWFWFVRRRIQRFLVRHRTV